MAEQQMQQQQMRTGPPATMAESAQEAMADILAVRKRERESWDAFWKLTKLEAGENLFKLYRYYAWRVVDIVPTWVRENIVEPLHDKFRWPYYHYKFPRIPSIDECKVGDEACRYEANFQYMLDRLVDSNILLILQENLQRCEKYYYGDYRRCIDARDEYEENELNYFIKLNYSYFSFNLRFKINGELLSITDVLQAYMKQKHRLIWERRHPRIMELRAKAYEKYKENLAKGVYDDFFYNRGTIFSFRKYQTGWSRNIQQRKPALSRDDISQDPQRLKEEQDLRAQGKLAYRMDEYKFWEQYP
uniref:NADH dehydrogenase [ubiquinone] 1 beta subcomplex subunit 10 n=1 Tax=Romanomermis culicivorax TaxID=13658 RepID=A0A915KXS2_ROMCU